MAQTSSCMGRLLFLARVRAPAPDGGVEPLTLASRSGLGPGANSPAQAGGPLASLSGVVASQGLAFLPPAESWPLSSATHLHLAGSPLYAALAKPMSPGR